MNSLWRIREMRFALEMHFVLEMLGVTEREMPAGVRKALTVTKV